MEASSGLSRAGPEVPADLLAVATGHLTSLSIAARTGVVRLSPVYLDTRPSPPPSIPLNCWGGRGLRANPQHHTERSPAAPTSQISYGKGTSEFGPNVQKLANRLLAHQEGDMHQSTRARPTQEQKRWGGTTCPPPLAPLGGPKGGSSEGSRCRMYLSPFNCERSRERKRVGHIKVKMPEI